MLNFDLAKTAAGQEIFQMGEDQGIEKGIELGIKRGKFEDIIEALETKFGRVPKSVIDQIRQADTTTLKHIFRLAIQAENMQTFGTQLEQILSES